MLGGVYLGQPYFGGSPTVVVVAVVVEMIPPTLVELIDSGLNFVELVSTGASLVALPTDGAVTPVLVSPGANQVEITD